VKRIALQFRVTTIYHSDVIRRLCGLMVWVLLAHLNLAANDLVCASRHGRSAGAAASDMMRHGNMHATAHASGTTARGETPCDAPARADCCASMASCSLSFGLPSPDVNRVGAAGELMHPDVATRAPRSRSWAPDPPPPRA
jgi:hypothetical protein